jgi:curved DNA-binding protein CbpA
VKTSIISVHKLPLDDPKSARAAHAILGSKPGASRKSIRRRFRKLSAKCHPDQGGDRSRFEAIKAAHDLLMKSIKPPAKARRGRPRKHFYGDKNWYVVNTNAKTKVKRGGRIVTVTIPAPVEGWNGPNNEGFDTEREAKASYHDLKVLTVKLLQAAIDNPSNSTAIALIRDLQRQTPHYEIVGPPGQQRTKTHRAAKKAREEEEAQKRAEYIASLTDRHGSRGEITGGWDSRMIENVTAAHDAAAGGTGATIPPARRSRGNGFRCFGSKGLPYIGNGPDPFDKFDGTADTADTYLDSRLSPQDEDDDTGTPQVFKSYDQLLCASVEDRVLPPVPGLNLPPQRAFSDVSKKTGEEIDEPEELEIEELGIYEGNDEFSEFPEWDGDDFTDILYECYVAPDEVPDPDPILYEHTRAYLKGIKQVWNSGTKRLEDRPIDSVPTLEPPEPVASVPARVANPPEILKLGNDIPDPIPEKLLT